MTRVLVVDEALPWPPDSGKRIRTSALLARLARSFDVAIAYHEDGTTPATARAAAEAAGLETLPVPRRAPARRGARFAWDLARNVPMAAPYMVMAHRTRAMRRLVAERLAGPHRPDLVHVEWTPLLYNLPRRPGVPVVVAAHNVEADIWRRTRKATRLGPRWAYVALQQAKVARAERKAFARADVVTAVAAHDAERIARHAGAARTVVVPNGVDETWFAPQPHVPVDPDGVAFVGALDWRPNVDGVLWFLDDVWPRVVAARPGARLVVAGRRPGPALAARLATAGVELRADLADVRPTMAAAAAFVVPLRIGGGSRLKICEALAMGRPVVSTTVGAEGLELGDGIALADRPQDLAAALLDALARPVEAAAQSARGRARVLATHRWDAIAPLQADAWRLALANPRHGAGA